jgi:FkbM family methyltransferase
VEADIWLARLIQKSARLKGNKDKAVSVLPAAISEFNSVESFLIAKRGRARNALEIASGKFPMGGIREKQFVPTLTLDTLSKVFPEPDFIKMDVEGAELLALKGGSKVISKIRPVFYIEVGQQVSKEIQRIFENERYRLFDGKSRNPIAGCVFNTFFAPEEKCAGTFWVNIQK